MHIFPEEYFSPIAAQQTGTAKLPAFFPRFQTEKCVLWANAKAGLNQLK